MRNSKKYISLRIFSFAVFKIIRSPELLSLKVWRKILSVFFLLIPTHIALKVLNCFLVCLSLLNFIFFFIIKKLLDVFRKQSNLDIRGICDDDRSCK